MTFNSYSFIFIFLPVFLLGVWGIQRFLSENERADTLMKLWLIVMSAFFFVGYGAFSICIFLLSIVWNLSFTYILCKKLRNVAFGKEGTVTAIKAVAIAGNALLLAGFKFFGGGAMPVAVSFYTFSQIMFIAELGKEIKADFNPVDYLCYILFFPKILQGPIADYKSVMGGLKDLSKKKLKAEDFIYGIMLFSMGLAKKVLLAQVLGKAVDFGYGGVTTMSALDAILVAVSYSFQLYFDFSGYCDMAEGICRMIGMELTRNFDAPYTSENIAEFWDRWHISLTKFFTRYVYIPLGGSRKGISRTYINILIVFLVSGIWHGNGLNFVMWGMMHGVLMVLLRIFRAATHAKDESEKDLAKTKNVMALGFRHAINTALTFIYVTAAWVFFRAKDISEALTLLGKIVSIDAWRGLHISIKYAECFMMDEIWYMFKITPIPRWSKSNYICMWIILIFSAIMIFGGNTARKIAEKSAAFICKKEDASRVGSLAVSMFYGVLFVWGVLSLGGVSTFLYVNF
ncbi:MBOAT family protein [Butyrivibrio sp. INlla16]|uniref:MBOAT family O-acyltransferase n=1 Tax=Butyrivibrio sp. INlla16 TaxID=1520807 RepID=UPI00087E7E2C|nr:MBOAT family O-acyltransferase [Butyrivibrio sp. INlla16]SDB46811.1 D-alanyl-lipoteichoic acid acyltransferase DltB, MBOAT superfamily [Butyrivibrio sp. INlla16]